MGISINIGRHKFLPNDFVAVCPQLFIAVRGKTEEEAMAKCKAAILEATGIDLDDPNQAMKTVDRGKPVLANMPCSDEVN